MSCARCEDLEEQVAYLKSELGLSSDATAVARLREALRISPGAARVLASLYGAKGRVVPVWALLEGRKTEVEESHLISVYASLLRRALGNKGAVINAWREGYRLSPEAIARVAEILVEGR